MKLSYVLKYPEEKKFLDSLYDTGYEGVEWAILDPSGFNEKKTHNISAIGTGRNYVELGLSLSDPDNYNRRKAIERMQEFISLGAKIEAPVIIGLMRGTVTDSLEKTLSRFHDSMKIIDKYAQDAGVSILMEPLNRYESFLNTATEMVEFMKEFESCQLLVDSYHFNIEERNFWEPIIKHAKWIGHVHVADSNRMWPGNAHIDFSIFFDALKYIGYDKWIAVEINNKPSHQTAMLNSIVTLRGLLLREAY